MLNVPAHTSAYSDFLYRAIDQLLKERGGAFTLKELSQFTGLKITPNMRRRVRHCVESGTLGVRPVLVGKRGSCNMYYSLTPPDDQMELPF